MASKTKYVEFDGVVSYAMIYKPDEFRGKRFWKLNLHVDEETEKAIRDVGIQTDMKDKPVENAEGKYFTFRRYTEKEFFKNGKQEKIEFNPPKVFAKDGSPLVDYDRESGERKGDPILIGNGSKIRVGLEVYDAGSFGKGCRLSWVKILDLIEYVPPEEVPEESEQVAPKEQAPKAEKTAGKVKW